MQKKIWFLKIFLFFAFIMGCSEMFGNNPFPAALEEPDVVKPDLTADFLKEENNTVGDNDKSNMDGIFNLEQQYKQDCS